ncbi:MAG: hypothetical protein GYA15_08330 [Leptolinea sp.]|jgi:hypothetical protein|nr:hypothetical protein [Leptolinea sp.]
METNPDISSDISLKRIKTGRVMLFWKNRHIKTLNGIEAARFIDKMKQADPRETFLIMAKATGNFKRGNYQTSPKEE